MSVTIRDVARAAGVSTATAARALGGYGHASPAARRKVSESARVLGYRPNVVARALVSRATTTVGLVVGDIENPFFAAAARGLADVMDAHGYTVLLANADEDAERERRAVDALRARQVDGMVVVPAPGASPGHLADLVAAERAARAARPRGRRRRGRQRARAQRGRCARRGRPPDPARPPPHRRRLRPARDHLVGRADRRLPAGAARGRHRRRPGPDLDRRPHPGRRRGGRACGCSIAATGPRPSSRPTTS